MTTLDVFNYAGVEVRTAALNEEPAIVLSDIAKILGYRSASDAGRMLRDHHKGYAEVRTLGGVQRMVVVTERGFNRLVIRSNASGAESVQDWITDEVLPAIRKTGSYSVQMPQDYASALRELATSVERQAALEVKIKDDAPKVLFADSVAVASTDILVGELAKILRGNGVDIGQNRLFERMRDEKYLISREGSDWNMPTQKSMDLGLFRIKEGTKQLPDGTIRITKTTMVTGKGQIYFTNRYAMEVTR